MQNILKAEKREREKESAPGGGAGTAPSSEAEWRQSPVPMTRLRSGIQPRTVSCQ